MKHTSSTGKDNSEALPAGSLKQRLHSTYCYYYQHYHTGSGLSSLLVSYVAGSPEDLRSAAESSVHLSTTTVNIISVAASKVALARTSSSMQTSRTLLLATLRFRAGSLNFD